MRMGAVPRVAGIRPQLLPALPLALVLALVLLLPGPSASFHLPTTRGRLLRPRHSRFSMSAGGGSAGAPRVLGLGVCGIDLLAYVDKYPEPDAKIRTSDFQVKGGGNAGNTLTGLSRLGVSAEILTKVGDDAYGAMIVDELRGDGLDTRRVIRKKGISSPFTYVIVESEGQTRTCIHTPSEDMKEEEIDASLLEGVTFLHLDGRNTLAAIKLATLARERGIPVMLDAEKDRPHLRTLVPLCDYLVTNTAFPKAFTGSATTEEGMAALLSNGHARLVTTTLGAKGSMVMGRVEELRAMGGGKSPPPDLPLATAASAYICPTTGAAMEVVTCAAWPVAEAEIVDTTGAGDAFIAGMIYGLVHGLTVPHTLNVASYVASQKLRAPGARAGLPRKEAAPKELHVV